MVVCISVHHFFKFPFELVFKTYVEKHLNDPESGVTSVQDVEFRKEGYWTCFKRLLTYSNYIPSFFRRDPVLNVLSIVMEEECWSGIDVETRMIRSRNITWEEEAVIANTVLLYPDKHNPQCSHWEQESVLDFNSFGKLGLIIELYLKRVLERKFKKDFSIMETVLAKQMTGLQK